jgi:hypothetical protein
MKVKFIKGGPGYGYGYAADQTGEIPDEAAQKLIKLGVVEPVKARTAASEPETKESKQVQAAEKRTSKRGRPKKKD